MTNTITSTIKIDTNIYNPFYIFDGISLEEFFNKIYNDSPKELTKSWLTENVGSENFKLENINPYEIIISSDNNPPKEFLIKLFNLFIDKDIESEFKVEYKEKSYKQIGVIAIKKIKDEIRYAYIEDKLDINEYDLDDEYDLDNLNFDLNNYFTMFNDEVNWMIEEGKYEVISKN